jgi:probable rRNA maturation factor
MISIDVANEQSLLDVDENRLKTAAEAVLRAGGIVDCSLSIAVVLDAAIHALNQKYLAHDYPTDVLSFVLERKGNRLEGEVIASAETAARAAPGFGWPATDELLLYVVHGTLHLVGYDDTSDDLRRQMRAAERQFLAAFGLELREERGL